MSIRDLFDNNNEEVSSVLSDSKIEDLKNDVGSEEFLEAFKNYKDRFIPHTDLSLPSNFARYGLAEKYYDDSILRIQTSYPYDGSGYEKTSWLLSSSYWDLHIFENEYPKTNGYAVISADGWGTNVDTIGDYGATATSSYEYIYLSSSLRDGNIIDSGTSRQYNLDLNPISGSTVEFWLKKDAFLDISNSKKEVVFDLWNNQLSQSSDYARFTVELTSSTTPNDSPFRVTYMSGTSGFSDQAVGDNFFTSSLLEGWNHYAFTFESGSSSSSIKFYLNGNLNNTVVTSDTLGSVDNSESTLNIGALLTSPSGNLYHPIGNEMLGWAKMSASIDDFRFWKEARTSRDIGRNWFTQVDGGSNSTYEQTTLGVYYKFNEGITTNNTIDEVVLDYSGRVSNAKWIGYLGVQSRSTGSAIVFSNAAESETKDPIIYYSHPSVVAYHQEKREEARAHDYSNNAAIIKSLPAWIVEEEEDLGSGELDSLIQIIASYFDTLQLQIDTLPRLKDVRYLSSSVGSDTFEKPHPFSDRKLEAMGFPAPELFADAEVLEFFKSRGEEFKYRESLHDIKNLIYNNIYNNLSFIYKSKGTEKSIRNLLHCYGIDEEVIRINLYSNNDTYEFNDRQRHSVEKKRYVDFYSPDCMDGTIIQYTSSNIPEGLSYIAGAADNPSGTDLEKYSRRSITIEAESYFPQLSDESVNARLDVPISCSLYGVYGTENAASNDYTWNLTNTRDIQVYAVRPSKHSLDAKFVIKSADSMFTTMETDVYKDVFDDNRWNFAIRIRPTKSDAGLIGIGDYISPLPETYDISFYGTNPIIKRINESFHLSGTISKSVGENFLAGHQRVYMGALRQNFTGSVLSQSYVRMSSLRYWLDHLSDEVLTQHAISPLNYGAENPIDSAYFYEYGHNHFGSTSEGQSWDHTYAITGSQVPKIRTLALNWDFSGLAGSYVNESDLLTNFEVTDMTSGSLSLFPSAGVNNHLGETLRNHYPGAGIGFPTESKNPIKIQHIQTAKKTLPEVLNNYDMIDIVEDSQQIDVFKPDVRPVNYYLALEKSMYQNISDEMLNMFATLSSFNNIIGEPVNKYRQNYKKLEKIRHLFFEKVEGDLNLDKFVDFYKWFDRALTKMIVELIPASARTSNRIYNIVESHILERNKYQHKAPSLDYRSSFDLEIVLGLTPVSLNREDIEERLRQGRIEAEGWSSLHAPLPRSPQDESDQPGWWQHYAEMDNGTFFLNSNYNSDIASDRAQMRKVIRGAREQRLGRLVKTSYKINRTYTNGPNFKSAKKYSYFKNSKQNIDIRASDIDRLRDIVYNSELFVKEKMNFISDGIGSGDKIAPFSIFSSSVETGYVESSGLKTLKPNIELTNLHHDFTNLGNEIPIQGPFTQAHVGGMAHRSTPLNSGIDTSDSRAEAWKIGIDSDSISVTSSFIETTPHTPRVSFFRDGVSKRPLNIKNIKYNTTSRVLGNYSKDYEVVQTSNRTLNNQWFVKSGSLTQDIQGYDSDSFRSLETKASVFIGGLKDYSKPQRGRTEHVIVERFSAPGGPETMGDSNGGPGLDTFAAEYSPYNMMNYRNRNVRNFIDVVSKQYTGPAGFSSFTQDTASWYTEAPSASYYKINRNPSREILYDDESGTGFVTGTDYDNTFLQRPIPAQDYGYAWITASAASYNVLGHAESEDELQFISASDVVSTLVSGDRWYGVTKQQAIDVGLSDSIVATDFAGLNVHIYEPVDTSRNTLGYDEYNCPFGDCEQNPPGDLVNYQNSDVIHVNVDDTGHVYPSYHGVLNAIILHRQGPYGWPTWKQLQGRNHPIRRYEVDNNIFSLVKEELNSNNLIVDNFYSYQEAPLTSRHKPLSDEFIGNDGTSYILEHSYGNQKSYFSDLDLNIKLFDSHLGHDRALFHDHLMAGDTLGVNFQNMIYREKIYPREANTFMDKSRSRINFTYHNIWNSSRSDRYLTGSTGLGVNKTGSQGVGINATSKWPLDARSNFETATAVISGTVAMPYSDPSSYSSSLEYSIELDDAGELQTINTVYQNHQPAQDIARAAIYSRRIMLGNGTAIGDSDSGTDFETLGGDALWETPSQSGYEPYYESYAKYAEVMKPQGKDYSILPEFKISDHISDYVDVNSGRNLLRKVDALFSLTGASLPDSADVSFAREYLHSDFLKYFEVFNDEYSNMDQDAKASRITLTCKAYKRFLPYEGLYPAERTLELAKLFWDTHGSLISGSADDDTENWRPIAQALFAPGILYNTIKSGIAVDYPIYTGSFGSLHTRSGEEFHKFDLGTSVYRSVGPSTGSLVANKRIFDMLISSFDKRVPFESIIEPTRFINHKIKDQEVHPLSTYSDPSIFYFNEDKRPSITYMMAVNNFLAESMNLFLRNSKPSRIVSKKIQNIRLNTGSYERYAMDVNLYQTKEFTMYGRASAFGPPCAIAGRYDGGAFDPWEMTGSVFDPFTPPYFDTYPGKSLTGNITLSKQPPRSAIARIIFPKVGVELEDKDYTIPEIINNSDVFYLRPNHQIEHSSFDNLAQAGIFSDNLSFYHNQKYPGATDAMQLSSSIELKKYVKLNNVTFDSAGEVQSLSETGEGNIFHQWVITPKFECPVYNFENSSITTGYDTSDFGFQSKGMWHQYGEIPDENQGIFMSVTDASMPDGAWPTCAGQDPDYTDSKGDLWNPQDIELTGSLADLLGFKSPDTNTSIVKIGDVLSEEEYKEVYEGVVAIPFILGENNQKLFFKIDKEHIRLLKQGDKNLTPLSDLKSGIPDEDTESFLATRHIFESMKKYVFPPQFNFLEFSHIDPIAMFVFEFNYKLSGKDLSNIWQNVMPPSSDITFAPGQAPQGHENSVTEASVIHPVLYNQFYNYSNVEGGKQLKWMVFKVKQKAAINYNDILRISRFSEKEVIDQILENTSRNKTVGPSDLNKLKKVIKAFVNDTGLKDYLDVPEFLRGYSYNWPYDYFSFVELVNIDAEVTYGEEPDGAIDDRTARNNSAIRAVMKQAVNVATTPSTQAALDKSSLETRASLQGGSLSNSAGDRLGNNGSVADDGVADRLRNRRR